MPPKPVRVTEECSCVVTKDYWKFNEACPFHGRDGTMVVSTAALRTAPQPERVTEEPKGLLKVTMTVEASRQAQKALRLAASRLATDEEALAPTGTPWAPRATTSVEWLEWLDARISGGTLDV